MVCHCEPSVARNIHQVQFNSSVVNKKSLIKAKSAIEIVFALCWSGVVWIFIIVELQLFNRN